ncbi:ABC transporter substrate-binding protein [Advenella kashmirensis W13003]|uniref:ABC transporter substrate-binding protein n=1 Tax=Advenella kashmirensis W13003 TaxID=1424334 RepID=V8QR78_9BURK|nr:tripartite tricarboxylate transporter substrate binding protein [Advenella kashmirensis]ETF02481.1 ABC transporter substrate-binding protein [Advenella kashmirensis W13003]
MRLCITSFVLACVAALGPASAAQTDVSFSERPIRLIVPSSPGSGLDNLARTFAPKLGQLLKQSVVVENLAGASNISGTRELVRAKPDGYTLELISSNHAVNPSLHKNLPYDSVKDITPISNLVTSPLVVAVPKTSPYPALSDLVAAAKKEPKRLNYGSAGVGTALHLAGVLFEKRAGVEMTHVPYKGGNTIVNDLISNQVQVAFLAIASVSEQIKGGMLRGLAVTSSKRSQMLPDMPTLAEAGVADYIYEPWLGMIAPANLPDDIRDKLQATLKETFASADVKNKLEQLGFNIVVSSPQAFGETIQKDIDESAALLK